MFLQWLIWDYSFNCNYIQWSGRSMTIFWWNVQSKTFANGQFKNFTAETWNIKYFFLSYFFLNLFMFLVLLMVMVWNMLILVRSRFKSRYHSWSFFNVLKQRVWQNFWADEIWPRFWSGSLVNILMNLSQQGQSLGGSNWPPLVKKTLTILLTDRGIKLTSLIIQNIT